MMRRRRFGATAGLTMAAMILTGCSLGGDGSNDSDASPQRSEGECTAERVGGSVSMAMATQPVGLDPIAVSGSPTTGGIELLQIYDSLLKLNRETMEYEPHVAESLEPNDSFDEWTLKLRPDVKFGNGDPLTAEAVKASIERFQSDENRGTYRPLARLITAMEVRDNATLVLRLEEPWAGFPFVMANGPGMIVNTRVADEQGEGFATDPAGAGVGPYEATSYVAGDEIVLTAKDDYWNGPVCIESLRLIAMPMDQGRYEAFRAGEIEAAWLRDSLVIAQTEDDGVPGITTFQNAANVLMLNSGKGPSPTNDVRVRRAIAHALDVDAIDDRENEGTGGATKAVLGENSDYYSGAKGLAFDRNKAAELLEEVKAEGYDGSLRVVCAKSSEEAGLAIEGQLKAAGFDVDYETVRDSAALVDRVIVKADYDVSCFGLNAVDEGLWATLSSELSSSSDSNYGGFSDPRVDAVLDDLRVAYEADEISASMDDLQEAWNDSVPSIPLNAAPNKTIHVDQLQNLVPTSNSLFFFAKAFLD